MFKNFIINFLIFIFFFIGSAQSNEIKDELFGVKLYDDIQNYILKEKGEVADYYDNDIYYNISEDFKDLKKNINFKSYFLVSKNDKILLIGGMLWNSIFAKYFEDKCFDKQESLKSTLINLYDLSKKDFKRNYYIEEFDGLSGSIRSDEFEFYYNGKKNTLILNCFYRITKSQHDEKGEVSWKLALSLVDSKYVKDVLKRNYKTIKKLDRNLILSDLGGL